MENKLLYLSRNDVEAVGSTMPEIIEAIESAMIEKGYGKTKIPPKTNMYIDDTENYLNAMPAYIPAQNVAGLKWVSAYPKNPKNGLPYVNGLIILNNPENGLPLAVLDAVWITTYRTGAATALSGKYLARKDSRILGILGCGIQGESNILALTSLFRFDSILVYDIDPDRTRNFAMEINSKTGIETISAKHPRDAVSGCDIVVTAGPITKPPHATIKEGWLERGAFASLVDYDAFWSSKALKEADKFCTDDTPQFKAYQGLGYFTDGPDVYADLGELAAGLKKGRQDESEITMAANLGNGLFDMATANLIIKKAKSKGIGKFLPI